MKLTNIFLIISLLLISLTACNSETNKNSNANNNANSTPSNATIPNIEQSVLQTPTEAANNFLQAVRQRNYAIVRECLSERSLNNLQQTIARSDINLDQTLKRIIDQDAQEMLANNVTAFEFRNEKIANNQASLEVKATNAPQYARISLSKENSQWKINIDETSPSQ